MQLGVGALVSTGTSVFVTRDSFPVIAILAGTSATGLIILLIGEKRAHGSTTEDATA